MPEDADELAIAEQPPAYNELWEWLRRAVKIAAAFVAHQYISTYGVIYGAPRALGFASDFLSLVRRRLSASEMKQILYGSPYFPLQIGLALSVAWLLGRRFRHRSMLFVWLMPLASLCRALIVSSALLPANHSVLIHTQYPLLSHFFGSDCQQQDDCYEQVLYTSALYSIGALLARKVSQTPAGATKADFSVDLTIGLILLIEALIELEQAPQRLQLAQMTLRGLSLPRPWASTWVAIIEIAAMFVLGAYLVRSAYRMRHQLRADDDEIETSTQADTTP